MIYVTGDIHGEADRLGPEALKQRSIDMQPDDCYPVKAWAGGRVHELQPNLYHLLRGEIFTIKGKTFFTFGGAKSTDKSQR